jgi:ComF family protein
MRAGKLAGFGGGDCCGIRVGVYSWASAELELLLLVPRVRSVFSSASVKDVQLGNGGPPGAAAGMVGWRAVTRVLRSCGGAAGGVVADLVNVMVPSDCRICGGPMVTLGKAQVCEACRERVGPQAGSLCVRCGDALGMESARMAGGWGEGQCSMCRMAPPEFARAVAFAAYEDDVREMLHLLKFGGMRAVAESVLGEGMAAAVLKLDGAIAGELIVVPVPLFKAREKSRGFNQARVLAEAGVRGLRKVRPAWTLTVRPEVLKRTRDTGALFGMNPRERRESLRGAFRVADGEVVRGREVLLVDDIMTTGATARECSRVLLKAGAVRVWVATFAKAQPEVASFGGAKDVARWDVVQPGPATGFV